MFERKCFFQQSLRQTITKTTLFTNNTCVSAVKQFSQLSSTKEKKKTFFYKQTKEEKVGQEIGRVSAKKKRHTLQKGSMNVAHLRRARTHTRKKDNARARSRWMREGRPRGGLIGVYSVPLFPFPPSPAEWRRELYTVMAFGPFQAGGVVFLNYFASSGCRARAETSAVKAIARKEFGGKWCSFFLFFVYVFIYAFDVFGRKFFRQFFRSYSWFAPIGFQL